MKYVRGPSAPIIDGAKRAANAAFSITDVTLEIWF